MKTTSTFVAKLIRFSFWILPLMCLAAAPGFSAEPVTGKGYVIGPGDVLSIQVWDHDDLNRTLEISQEGDIAFPLIGKVHAAGSSVFELEYLLKKRLGAGYIVSPQVTVGIQDYQSRKVQVLGEVKKPGTYVLKRNPQLLELISEAGGLTTDAGRIVTILRSKSEPGHRDAGAPGRAGRQESIRIDLLDQLTALSDRQSLTIRNGDTVVVGKAARLFVTGRVEHPGEIKWEKDLTVDQAIALAGGPTQEAAPNRTVIVRTENGRERKFKPQMTDLVQPNDIIKVPASWF